MDLQNVSGEAIALTKLGVTIANGATATGIDDKWLQDEDIAALVSDAKLVASNYDASAGSAVVQPEVAAALAASHTHANQAELDLVTDGDHDVSDGSSHSAVVTNSAHVAGDGSDHSVVATNAAHVAGDGSDHANVATNSAHVAGDGSDHSVVAANAAHVAITAANPHGVDPTNELYTPTTPADWAGTAPTNVQQALDRIAAQLAVVGAVPIP